MERLISIHNDLFSAIERHMSWVLPLLARFLFAAILLQYFWNSGLTKLGEGFFGFLNPSFGAYAQIFPKAVEAAEYDPANLSAFHWLVTVAGTWAEFILPALIIIGLMTRLAALGMIGFVVVQSLTDLYGHGGIEHEKTLGAWFDRFSDGLILDQRAFWVFILLVLVIKGAGLLSFDYALKSALFGKDDETA